MPHRANTPEPDLCVLYVDNHLLAVDKPAGVLVQADRTGDPSLLEAAREWIRVRFRKPGNVFCGLVHRLDRPASGVVLFARTSKAAARLSDQFRRHAVAKVYRVVVHGRPPKPADALRNRLLPGREGRRTRIAQGPTAGRPAVLQYRVLAHRQDLHELEVRPETGRKHQIRAQLAHIGCPVVGDRRYGSRARLHEGRAIALHAEHMTVRHPTRDEDVDLHAPLPTYWPLTPQSPESRSRRTRP